MMKRAVYWLAAVALIGATSTSALADARGKKIAYMTTAIQLPYISTLAQDLTEASKALGMQVTVFSSPFDPAIQSQQMDNAIARKFDMIVLTAVSEQAIVPSLLRANKAGIPVLGLVVPPKKGTEKYYVSFVGDDQAALGRNAARSIMKAIKASGHDGGNIAAITGSLQEGVAPVRLKAFKQVLERDPKFKLVAVEDVAWDTAKSGQAAGQLLARFAPQGGLAGIWGMADNQAVAIIQAVKAAGLTPGVGPKDVVVVSSNCYRDGIKAIKDGTLYSTGTQVPGPVSKQAARAAADYFNGKAPPVQIIIPAEMITKSNADKWAAACNF